MAQGTASVVICNGSSLEVRHPDLSADYVTAGERA